MESLLEIGDASVAGASGAIFTRDITIGNAAGEGRVAPLIFAGGLHRDDIHVPHKRYRFEIAIPALPSVKQTVFSENIG